MKACKSTLAVGLLLFAVTNSLTAVQAQQSVTVPQHAFFHVTLDKSFNTLASGRLLLFISPFSPGGKSSESVDMQMMALTSVYIAAKEVPNIAPGASVDIDADDVVFPAPLSQATSGKYQVQAVLGVHHSYNYDGRSAGDIVSTPAVITVSYST